MEIFSEIKEINTLIFNYLDVEWLKMLMCVNKKFNNEIKNIILKYDICLTTINVLNEIRNKNSNESIQAEHLLLEMYYDMKKYHKYNVL